MGILAMLGLVTAEDHAKVAKDLAVANGETVKAAAIITRQKGTIDIVTAERDKFRQQVRDTCARAEKAEAGLAEAKAAYDNEHSDLNSARDTISGLRAQIEAAEQVIAELKPDAEATRRRRANDANRVRPSRAKKVKAPAAPKPAPKAKAAAKKAVAK